MWWTKFSYELRFSNRNSLFIFVDDRWWWWEGLERGNILFYPHSIPVIFISNFSLFCKDTYTCLAHGLFHFDFSDLPYRLHVWVFHIFGFSPISVNNQRIIVLNHSQWTRHQPMCTLTKIFDIDICAIFALLVPLNYLRRN